MKRAIFRPPRSHRAWLCETPSPLPRRRNNTIVRPSTRQRGSNICQIDRFRCRVDKKSAMCAFYSSTWQIRDIFDVSLFSAYDYFIETGFNKVVININKSITYLVLHQPKMSIISESHGWGIARKKPRRTIQVRLGFFCEDTQIWTADLLPVKQAL